MLDYNLTLLTSGKLRYTVFLLGLLKEFILLFTCLVLRQQWKDEKNALEKQITDLEKKLKGNEENLRRREKEYKKVVKAKTFYVSL